MVLLQSIIITILIILDIWKVHVLDWLSFSINSIIIYHHLMYYSPSLFPLPNPCSLSSLFATHTLDIPNAIITSPYLILSFLYAYATTAEKKLQTHTHDTISMQKVKENTPFIIPTCIIHLKKDFIPPFPFFVPFILSPAISVYIWDSWKRSIQLVTRITDLFLVLWKFALHMTSSSSSSSSLSLTTLLVYGNLRMSYIDHVYLYILKS